MDDSAVEVMARRFVPGRGPVEIVALHAGLVNASYRVTRDGTGFVLRVRAARGEAPGVDRVWEQRVLERVSAVRLAPVVRVCEPVAGVLVTQWVEGASWTAAQASDNAVSVQVAQLARAVHEVSAPQPVRAMNPVLWRDLYLAALREAPVEASRQAVIQQWTSLAQPLLAEYASLGPSDTCLCHSDLHRHNIVPCASGLVLLDWEYAHVGDPFWDLAGWASCCDLNAGTRLHFLAAYLQRDPQRAQIRRLQVLCGAYDYICLLWMELYQAATSARGESGAAAAELCARTRLLAARFTSY
jgi:thiamine kinase-like enzyme